MTNFSLKSLAVAALLLLGFTACNKDVSEPQYSETSQVSKPQTEQYYLDIITGDSEEMRLAQKVYEHTGATTGVFLEEKDLAIQIAVRRKGGDGQIASQLLRFEKIQGAPRARYTGVVEVPSGAGNEVEIAGIVLGEWTGVSKTAPQNSDVKFMTKESGDFFKSIKPTHLLTSSQSVVRTKIPYIVDWTTAQLTASEDGKQRIEPIQLLFKPSGTILRLQVRNALAEQVQINQIKVKTNAFVEQWHYNFGNGLVQANKLMGGEVILPTALPLEEQTYTWLPEQPITLPAAGGAANADASKSKWFYTWVMGTKSTSGPRKIEFSLVGDGGKTYDAVFKTSAELKDGQTMWIPLTVSSSKVGAIFDGAHDGAFPVEHVFKNPLEHLVTSGAPHHYGMIVKGKASTFEFVDPSQLNNIAADSEAYYNFAQATTLFDKATGVEVTGGKAGKKYRLPSIKEWGSILPTRYQLPSAEHVANYYFAASDEVIEVPNEEVQFIGEANITQTTSKYKADGTYIYALRFTNIPQRLCAFRYHYSNGYLTITSRYLGEHSTDNIEAISKPSYWKDSDLKVSLRALGHRGIKSGPGAATSGLDTYGWYWTSTSNDEREGYRIAWAEAAITSVSPTLKARFQPVVLISVD